MNMFNKISQGLTTHTDAQVYIAKLVVLFILGFGVGITIASIIVELAKGL